MSETKSGTAGTLFKEGKLAEAVEAANAAVRAAPGDIGARTLLAELLLFAGNFERADVILDAGSEADPSAVLVIAEFRQLLRAETARRQLRRDGRVPEFLGEPTEALRHALAGLVALRADDVAGATREAAASEAARPRAPGTQDGQAFDDFRDADDLVAGYFEVLTTTGKFYWIPTERVESITFHAPKRPRDLFWRRASMVVRDGPDGDVYLPVLYGNDAAEATAEVRLGRTTEWHEQAGADGTVLVRGLGQRMFLVGEDALGIMDLKELVFG